MKREYIYIYFPDGVSNNRNKKDLTIAFNEGDPLYNACKRLNSAEIRETLGIYRFKELLEKAKDEDRSPGNYIKHKLRKKLLDEEGK